MRSGTVQLRLVPRAHRPTERLGDLLPAGCLFCLVDGKPSVGFLAPAVSK